MENHKDSGTVINPSENDDETYSEAETERRREELLKRILSTPPKHRGKSSGDIRKGADKRKGNAD